jgi:NitT/TauT family transport system permease protein
MRGDRLLPLLVALLALGAWAALAARLPAALLPSPVEVAARAVAEAPRLAEATAQTALAALIGLGGASVAGFAGGLLFLRSRAMELALYPYALLVQTLPIVAVAPLLIVWLGYGLPVAATSAGVVAFFPMLSGAHLGLQAAEPEQVELMRLYGATPAQELWRLRLPGSVPHLMGALRTAAGMAVIGAIVGEFVGSNGAPPSLGFLVLHSARSADTGLTFAAIAAAAVLAVALYGAVRALDARLVGRWRGEPSP